MFVILFSVTEALNHYNQGGTHYISRVTPVVCYHPLLDPQQNHIPGYVPEPVRDIRRAYIRHVEVLWSYKGSTRVMLITSR